MKFKSMDPNSVRALLDGHVDILTPLVHEEEAKYKNLICPNCHGRSCKKKINDVRTTSNDHGQFIILPFNPNHPLPLSHAICIDCDTEFNPDSGLIIK